MSTLSFDDFWAWLQLHPNCIVRVATPEAVLYDDADLHWYAGEDSGDLVLQLIRGKRLVGELLIDPERVTYVQVVGEEREGEFSFEAISETPSLRLAAYTFVMTHALEEESQEPAHGAVIH